jgi:hypothetical protein
MKAVISIFALPGEIDDLALLLQLVKRNSLFLSGTVRYRVEVTIALSDELTNWTETKIPQEYFAERARELCENCLNWCEYECHIERGNEILGCVSQRRRSLYRNPDAEFFIWLDSDLFFPDDTLCLLERAYLKHNSDDSWCIVTPEVVRQWDETWDLIVNQTFLDKPTNYHLTVDTIAACLKPLGPRSTRICPTFKLAGGWATLISGKLLRKLGIPDGLGHYGNEDTFVSSCTGYLKRIGFKAFQVVIENLIVGEMRAFRSTSTIRKYISSKDRREEFLAISAQNWNKVVCDWVLSMGPYVGPK